MIILDFNQPSWLNSPVRTRADLRFTYAHILTVRTHFAKPAQNERRFFTAKRTCATNGPWNEHVTT